MLGYDFEIIYKKGMKNVVADALFEKYEDVNALLCYLDHTTILDSRSNGIMEK